jgi:hypothetical protein
MHPPDPETRSPATRQSGRAVVEEKDHKQKQRYSISVETQPCLSILLPIVVIVVLLAIGARL